MDDFKAADEGATEAEYRAKKGQMCDTGYNKAPGMHDSLGSSCGPGTGSVTQDHTYDW